MFLYQLVGDGTGKFHGVGRTLSGKATNVIRKFSRVHTVCYQRYPIPLDRKVAIAKLDKQRIESPISGPTEKRHVVVVFDDGVPMKLVNGVGVTRFLKEKASVCVEKRERVRRFVYGLHLLTDSLVNIGASTGEPRCPSGRRRLQIDNPTFDVNT